MNHLWTIKKKGSNSWRACLLCKIVFFCYPVILSSNLYSHRFLEEKLIFPAVKLIYYSLTTLSDYQVGCFSYRPLEKLSFAQFLLKKLAKPKRKKHVGYWQNLQLFIHDFLFFSHLKTLAYAFTKICCLSMPNVL